MTKKEAADLLGVSERAIERYTAKGLLAPRYERRAGQRLAIYDQKQVKLLRRQMQQGAGDRGRGIGDSQSLTPNPQPPSPHPRRSIAAASSRTAQAPAAEQLLAAITELAQAAALPLDRKLGLCIEEAAQLTGLSGHFIRRAIKAKRLKATRPGRAWHIKRRDLELWHAKL
ncbi:MAG: helix-turn-helix domain-containing protein [Blastocatellia bacterium]